MKRFNLDDKKDATTIKMIIFWYRNSSSHVLMFFCQCQFFPRSEQSFSWIFFFLVNVSDFFMMTKPKGIFKKVNHIANLKKSGKKPRCPSSIPFHLLTTRQPPTFPLPRSLESPPRRRRIPPLCPIFLLQSPITCQLPEKIRRLGTIRPICKY